MANCGNLSANITKDCSNPIRAGVGDTLYLVNYEDWQDATVTAGATNNIELTAITMASSKFIYKVEMAAANSIRPRYEISRENGRVRFKHYVEFSIERDDPDTKEQIQQLDLGRFVAIVFTNTDRIEVFGADTGLTREGGEERNFYANQGAFTLTLSSDDETLEPWMPKTYVGTSSPYSFSTAKADITAQVAS